MAFEHKRFSNGEASYRPPYWKKVVDDIHESLDAFDYQTEKTQRQSVQEDEVALKHPKNQSFIRIKDDGTIEAFTGYGSGWRIKPNETVQVFGDKIQLIGRETQLETSPNASRINQRSLDGTYPVRNTYKKDRTLKQLIDEEEA